MRSADAAHSHDMAKTRKVSQGPFSLYGGSKTPKQREKCFAEMLYLLQQAASNCKLSLTKGNRLPQAVSYPLPKVSPGDGSLGCSC
jgi:hypothetical protein